MFATKSKLAEFLSPMLIMATTFFMTSAFAQNDKNTAKSNSSNGDESSNPIMDYYRPGKYHQLLADLVGSWTFKGTTLEWVDPVTSKVTDVISGTAVRKSFANGRFFFLTQQNGKYIKSHEFSFTRVKEK